jgi:regulator of sigma E protease
MGSFFSSHLQGFGGGVAGQVILFLCVLSVVVFVHELGHFLVGRACRVRILVFSIGFGPELVGFNDRRGTRWKISAIPLGGYVKFFGDENAASASDGSQLATMNEAERSQSFIGQSVLKRAAIVVAGPLANFVLAIAIFAGTFMYFGKPLQSPETMTARVDQVLPGSPAAVAGFQPGDVVVSIDGHAVGNFADMQRIVSESAGIALAITIERDGGKVVLNATPKTEKDMLGNRIGRLGIQGTTPPGSSRFEPVSPPRAVWLGVQETWAVIDGTLNYIGGVIVGHKSPDQLSGPIGIARVVGRAATISFSMVIHITAVISVSIGLLNLFPIPLLDGGHLLFYAIEAARGRPLSERAQEFGFRIGLAIVLMLMIFATFNDIVHLATS